jgi:hypothetical protein
MELQAALSLVQGSVQPSFTAANTFINETEATASQYIITEPSPSTTLLGRIVITARL